MDSRSICVRRCECRRRSARGDRYRAIFTQPGPRLCEKSHRCYDSAGESASGSDGCQASWKGLIGARAACSQPNLKTMWPKTIWFARLTLLLMVLILAGLALVGLRRWKEGGDAAQDLHLWLSQ